MTKKTQVRAEAPVTAIQTGIRPDIAGRNALPLLVR